MRSDGKTRRKFVSNLFPKRQIMQEDYGSFRLVLATPGEKNLPKTIK